jgi:glutamine---fructose-6-phosphate transaminase (isomerizing)
VNGSVWRSPPRATPVPTRSDRELAQYALEVARIPEKLEAALRLETRCCRNCATPFPDTRLHFFGRGPHYPIALDGALKHREDAYIHAEGYPGGESKHGQITVMDDEIVAVLIASCDSADPDSVNRSKQILPTTGEIKAFCGKVVVLATEGDENAGSVANEVLTVPSAPELLSQL